MDDASEALAWIPSDTIWLDKDVSSDFYIPPQPFPVTKNLKVVRLKRVHGIPSQFPIPRVSTAYIVNFSSVRDSYKDADGEVPNLEKILKDKVRILPLCCKELITAARIATRGMGPQVNGRQIGLRW